MGEDTSARRAATGLADPAELRAPAYALRVLEVLEAAGFEAWIVGGWVRDALLCKDGHDVDVTTSALWQESASCLRDAGIEVHETGTQHGTVCAVVEGKPVEVTTYRVESAYTDFRHPDEVRFVREVREDLGRRDFTVNAMAWHPFRGLLDPYNGRDDLAAEVIRCVGDATSRLTEDALRVLRAVRFACRMGFDVDPQTREALKACAPGLSHIAQERIGAELEGIIGAGHGARAMREHPEVMCAAIPELAPMVGFEQRNPYHAFDVYTHTTHVAAACEAFAGGMTPRSLRWAAIMHDVAKPMTFSQGADRRGHFYGHPQKGAEVCRRIMRRMALPETLVREACCLVRHHDFVPTPTRRAVLRLLGRLEQEVPGGSWRMLHYLLDLRRADGASHAINGDEDVAKAMEVELLAKDLRAQRVALRVGELAVDGRDVMRTAGIAPGRDVGRLLGWLLEQVTEGAVENEREALLALLAGHFGNGGLGKVGATGTER